MTEVDLMNGESFSVDTVESVEPLMTAEEAAAVLRVSPDWVYRAARADDLPCVRMGPRIVRFRRADIEEFVRKGGSQDGPQ